MIIKLILGAVYGAIEFPFSFLLFGIFFGWDAGFHFATVMSMLTVVLWTFFSADKRYSN